jgi:hypothetical protein
MDVFEFSVDVKLISNTYIDIDDRLTLVTLKFSTETLQEKAKKK